MNLSVDRSPVIIIVTAFIVPLTTILVFLRCYVRLSLQKKKFSIDDYLILFSFLNFIGIQILTILDIKWGTGKHLIAVLEEDPANLPRTLKTWWIGQHLYLYATCSVKVSVAIFFCSLSPPRYLCIIAIATACFSVLTGIGTEIYQIFQCWPVEYFWTRFDPTVKGSCMKPHSSLIILQIVNSSDIVTDFILALLPAIMLWGLNMRRKQKFAVSILLGLGALPAVAAIIRAFYFKASLLNPSDFTYSEFPTGLTSHLEPAIAICVVCAAQLRPLLRKVIPKSWLSSSKGSSTPNIVTFGQAGGRPHGKPEISMDERLDPAVYDEEAGNEKTPSSHLQSQHSHKEPGSFSESSHFS